MGGSAFKGLRIFETSHLDLFGKISFINIARHSQNKIIKRRCKVRKNLAL